MQATRSPTRLSRLVSLGAGAVALVTSGFYAWPALTVGTAGLALLGAGLAVGAAARVTLGAVGLLVAGVVAGVAGAPVLPVLVAVAAAAVAWDVGQTAVDLGEQLGREADTRRLEATTAAVSVGVGAVTVAAGYGLYRIGGGGLPIEALAFLAVAAVLLATALE